jgi:hypothetical protein
MKKQIISPSLWASLTPEQRHCALRAFYVETHSRHARHTIQTYGLREGRPRVITSLVREAATPGYHDWQSEACLTVALRFVREIVHEFDRAEAASVECEEGVVAATESARAAANRRAYLEHDATIQQAVTTTALAA